MDGNQPEWPRADLAVPANESVLADRSFKPRNPRDQDQHHKHEVGAGESRKSSDGDLPTTRGSERGAGLSMDEKGDDEPETDTGNDSERVSNSWPRTWKRAVGDDPLTARAR